MCSKLDPYPSQILHDVDPILLHSLEPAQKRTLLSRELALIHTTLFTDARVLLTLLEMLLLLLWQHIVGYAASAKATGECQCNVAGSSGGA